MKTVSLVRGIAVIGVVLAHSIGWVYLGQSWLVEDFLGSSTPIISQEGSTTYWFLHAIQQLLFFSVPAFFFASGFFISTAERTPGSLRYGIIWKWIYKIFWPFLFWLMIGTLADWLPLALFSSNLVPSFYSTFIKTLSFNWFVIAICQFYLLSPIFLKYLQKSPLILLLIAFLIQISTSTMTYVLPGLPESGLRKLLELFATYSFGRWVLYFTLGLLYSRFYQQVLVKLKGRTVQIAILTILLGFLSILELRWSGRLDNLAHPNISSYAVMIYSIAMLALLLLTCDKIIIRKEWIYKISAKSLGVYLAQIPIIIVIARTVYHTVPSVMFAPIPFLVVLFLPGLLLPMALGNLLLKLPDKRMYHLAFG